MPDIDKCFRRVRVLCALLFVCATSAIAGQAVQPGFYSHEPADVGIRIDNASSGEICNDAQGADRVCNKAIKIIVTGRETCTAQDNSEYPCTRYGYQFDYQGAEAGESIQCKVKRQTAFKTDTGSYTLDLTADQGSLFLPSWVAYSVVDKRVILSEVHECSYRGSLLSSIEFMLYYEPDSAPVLAVGSANGNGIDEPIFTEIPRACDYLPESLARTLMRVERVRPSAANEHIPNFWSQCIYSGQGVSGRKTSFIFKFMLYDLYDVANLDPVQLDFNATFTGGGDPPADKLTDLGKISYVFEKRDGSTLMVVTGIQGPADGAGRPTEFIANYFLSDPDTPHAARLEKLRAQAREHLLEWHSR